MVPTLPNGEPQRGQSAATHTSEPGSSSAQAFGPSGGSGLLKASLQAGVGFAIVIAGLTFGPYFWEKSHAATNAAPKPSEKGDTPSASQPAVAPAPTPADPNAGSKAPPSSPTAGKPPNGKDDILNKLGENGTKAAPTKVNPLDKKDDDLLKDIK
jgi:hypothetical protein